DLLDDVLASMLDAEAGQQGFLLTGQEDYLGPFEEALARADEQVANLESQVSDNPEQQGRARRLAGLVEERRRLLREGVRLRRRRRQAVADDYRRQQEWLQVTLLGIGDGVIAADRAGAVNFLNPIAEQLTGWTPQAARGRPVAEVLRLSDEGSGAPLQDPVRRV